MKTFVVFLHYLHYYCSRRLIVVKFSLRTFNLCVVERKKERIIVSFDSSKVIQSLTLAHENRRERGSFSRLWQWRAMLLRGHFLTLELTTLAIFLTPVRVMSNIVSGHMMWGIAQIPSIRSFSLPLSMNLSMVSKSLLSPCIICCIWSKSLSSQLYHRSQIGDGE